MLPESMVKPRLELGPGKYVEEPNVVLVPDNRKSFPVKVVIQMESRETYVMVSPNRMHVHQWCVLDAKLKQVMVGEVRHGRPLGKSVAPVVARNVMGGGAPNPDDFDILLTAAKLKPGASYTLVCTVYGVLAALGFTAIGPPKKAAAKPAKAAARRKPARRAAKKAPRKKRK